MLSRHNQPGRDGARLQPRLSLIREERDTNAQTLDYKRNRAELSFVKQFRGRCGEIAAQRSRCHIIPVTPCRGSRHA